MKLARNVITPLLSFTGAFIVYVLLQREYINIRELDFLLIWGGLFYVVVIIPFFFLICQWVTEETSKLTFLTLPFSCILVAVLIALLLLTFSGGTLNNNPVSIYLNKTALILYLTFSVMGLIFGLLYSFINVKK